MYRAAKRLCDILIALIALLILSPILVLIMIALLLTGEHEVFYRQTRIGAGYKTFGIWKFATMLKDSPNIGTGSLTVRGDPRVTVVGRFLRATKINELPQLINVLTGEMSLVGTRPQMKVDFDLYPPDVRDAIYSVPPGVTGIGLIVFRDEELLLSRPGVEPASCWAGWRRPRCCSSAPSAALRSAPTRTLRAPSWTPSCSRRPPRSASSPARRRRSPSRSTVASRSA